MKTTLKLLLVLTCIFTFNNYTHSQDKINIDDVNIYDLGDGQHFGHKRDKEKTPLSGKVRIITGYTSEYIDAEFDDKGLAIGKWEYYKNRDLRSYISYKNGYKDGECASLTASGDIEEKGEYLSGDKNGEWIKYYDADRPKEVKTYQKGDLINTKTYYTTGQLEMERNFLNKKEHGFYRKYNLEGEMTMDQNYVKGKKSGKQYVKVTSNLNDYYETSNYNDKGMLDGDFIQTYVDTKHIKSKGKYKNGQKDGKWVYETYDGKPLREEIYENGDLKETKKF